MGIFEAAHKETQSLLKEAHNNTPGTLGGITYRHLWASWGKHIQKLLGLLEEAH